MKQERNTAIVLAAGQGKRMHSKIQKQFLEIDHRPVLYYSLECFQKSPLIQEIILVTGEEMISYCKREIVERYHFTKVTKVIAGGKERYDSVYQGLRSRSEPGCLASMQGQEAKIFTHHLDISKNECYITNRTKDKGRGCGSL